MFFRICNIIMDELFVPLVVLSQIFAIATLVLLGVWTGNVLGGFAWDGSMKQFNFHPLFMIIGLVIINGDGKYFCCYTGRFPEFGQAMCHVSDGFSWDGFMKQFNFPCL